MALWIAAGANPKEAATRAGHTSVSFTLDRYGHLFPGSEQRLNDALDLLAEESDDRADDGPAGPEVGLRARKVSENPVSIAHVARTPTADTASDEEPQASDQGERGGPWGTQHEPPPRDNRRGNRPWGESSPESPWRLDE